MYEPTEPVTQPEDAEGLTPSTDDGDPTSGPLYVPADIWEQIQSAAEQPRRKSSWSSS